MTQHSVKTAVPVYKEALKVVAKPSCFITQVSPIVARWHLCIVLIISTNTALPARVNFVEFDSSETVRLRLLDGTTIKRRREDLRVVECLDRPRGL